MSAPEALPITRAPRFLAICEAYEPTPPAAPWIRIVIPGLAATTSRTICSAVDPAVGSAAAVVKSIEFGMTATVDAGAAAYSAYVPCANPNTRSPAVNWVTSLPGSTTSPAKSCPIVMGKCAGITCFNWWPIRREAQLSERLAAMPVRIRYMNEAAPEAWRRDWPAVSPRIEPANDQGGPRDLNQAS